jgi:integrase
MSSARSGRPAKVKTRKARFLDEMEVERIASETPDRYRALKWTLAVGGLRIGEATVLRVGDST